MKKYISLTALAMWIVSCGGNGGSSGVTKQIQKPTRTMEERIDIDSAIDGQYLAKFEPVNLEVTGKISGAFTFSRDTLVDEMVGDVRFAGGSPNQVHAQNVRIGTRCPTKDDDKNDDRYIDALEGEAVYGKVLFPLDGDLNSQSSYEGVYPVGDTYGNYIYSRVAKFSSFVKDLRTKENYPDEGYAKLGTREPLQLVGKVVIIHGVSESAHLPATVRSTRRTSIYQTFPVACGVIEKVVGPPGYIDDGTYLGTEVTTDGSTQDPIKDVLL